MSLGKDVEGEDQREAEWRARWRLQDGWWQGERQAPVGKQAGHADLAHATGRTEQVLDCDLRMTAPGAQGCARWK